ncbi:MAG: radical SAM protein [bacterium]|nr:radical SAM protein [bacterium]MDT8365744.1 radical SAM protein [bacterium]
MTQAQPKPTKENIFELKWLAWEITGKCNLNCIHCRSSSGMGSDEGDFTLDEAKKFIDDITSFAHPVVVLSGGEPLLRKDVFDIAAYGTSKGLRMAMATNGSLVDDSICEKIKASGIRIVSLSLDGSTAGIHDDFRKQPGAFEDTLRASGLFKKHGIEFLINSSFTKRNQDDIPNVYKQAKKMGATAWYMFMIVPMGRGEDLTAELISKEDYDGILKWHFEMELEEKDMLVRPTCAPHYYRIVQQEAKAKGLDFTRRNIKFGTGGGKGCIAAQSIAFVGSRGEVQPCSYFPQSAGNVKQQHFKEIWDSSELFKDMRSFKDYKGRCGSCEYIGVCGGCRARALAISDDYMEEEPFCDHVPVKVLRDLKKEEQTNE